MVTVKGNKLLEHINDRKMQWNIIFAMQSKKSNKEKQPDCRLYLG